MEIGIYHSMHHRIEDLTNAVALLLRKGPITPDDVSTTLGVSWSTAQTVLLRLTATGAAKVTRKGRVNVYFLGGQLAEPHTPSWARVRDLEELSIEISQYFPEGESAAKLIRKERRRG